MDKKYSKNNLKKKRWIKILIVFFAVIFLTSVSFLIFINVKISGTIKNKNANPMYNTIIFFSYYNYFFTINC